MSETLCNVVCEGGGIRGVGLVGGLALLAERGYRFQYAAGSSAGAIVTALLAAGYTPEELRVIISEQAFTSFFDQDWEDRIPVAGAPLSLLRDNGLYEGETLRAEVARLLAARGVRTFGDLVVPGASDNPGERYRLQVIASDITARRMLVLPRDAREHLGVEPDSLNVALAVRMSAGFPIVFEPVRWVHPATAEEHLIVDGGLLSNYPVWLFDGVGDPDTPAFGLQLVDSEPSPRPRDDLLAGGNLGAQLLAVARRMRAVDYLLGLAMTAVEAHDRRYIEEAKFARTIAIPTLGIGTFDFSLPAERLNALYDAGRQAAEEFLATWSHAGFRAAYGAGPKPSRRATVAARMQAALARGEGVPA
jgi:NTE family protein